MTGADAVSLLQHPRFGNKDCIRAVKVYAQMVRIKAFRREFGYPEELENLYGPAAAPEPEGLTEKQMAAEIRYWQAAEGRCA